MFPFFAKAPPLSRLGKPPRILLVRNDGLGDLILTLPLAAALKAQLPGCHLDVLAAAPFVPLLERVEGIDGVVADGGFLLKRHRQNQPPEALEAGRQALLQRVKAGRYHLALLAYAENASARLVQQAAIPWRVGPLRRPYFWRFTHPYRHSRSASPQAEYQLNLRCLEPLGLSPSYQPPRLNLEGIKLPPGVQAGRYAVIHPYKRNATALAWPMGRFVQLAHRLMESGLRVVAVGDAADAPVLESLLAHEPSIQRFTGLSLLELAQLVAKARLFVGNSSGPLHLAGLVGTPQVAFFPQNRVSAPARWRTLPPDGAGESGPEALNWKNHLLAPAFPIRCVKCRMERCPAFNCLNSLTVEEAWRACQYLGIGVEQAGHSPGND